VYLWMGDKLKAYECAKEVVNAKNPNGSSKFVLGVDGDFNKKDYVLTAEHIWSLYDFNLFQKYTDMFASGNLKKGSTDAKVRTELYGNTATDIRETKLWNLITTPGGQKCYVTRKYQSVEKPAYFFEDFKRIPMLRVSEMYLIMAEAGTGADAQAAWAAYRSARNIPVTTLPVDPAAAQTAIMKEYRKEFFAEGQAFYAYKRANAPANQVLWSSVAYPVNYLPPIPKAENVQ